MLRWAWRQLTSMRTALVLLLLLALAAVPGSVIPQESVDSLGTTRWKEQHPKLTPIYEKLDLFSVFDSAWFSAIYILLMVSLVGCFVPRILVYWRGLRAQPPAAPRHLTRLPDHTTYTTDDEVADHLEHARAVLRRPGLPAARRRGRRGQRGARLPPRSRQPGLPRVGAHRAGRLRRRRAVRLQGRGDPGRGVDVLQQPHPVRRLRTPAACSGPSRWSRSRSPSTSSTSTGWSPGRGPGWRSRSTPASATSESPDAAREELRPAGQPPALDRRHRDLPDRPRLRAGGDGARRQRRHRLQRTHGVPAAGRELPVLRRDQGLQREAGQDRPRGAVLPDLPDGRRRPGHGDGRRQEPDPLDARLHRRPGRRLRYAAVGLRPRQVQRRAGQGTPTASRSGSTSSRGRP